MIKTMVVSFTSNDSAMKLLIIYIDIKYIILNILFIFSKKNK